MEPSLQTITFAVQELPGAVRCCPPLPGLGA